MLKRRHSQIVLNIKSRSQNLHLFKESTNNPRLLSVTHAEIINWFQEAL